MEKKETENEIVFDNYAKTYKKGLQKTLRFSGLTPNYFHHYKVKELFLYLKNNSAENIQLKILDFGCGVGCSDSFLSHYFPKSKIYACDISEESINYAKEENSQYKNLIYAPYKEGRLPFDEKFDVIFVANVFHHIARKNQQSTINMLKSSLNENGFLIIFEHNPYNPITDLLALLTDYRYDKNTNLLSPLYMKKLLKNTGFKNLNLTYKVFFPGFMKIFLPLEKYLKKCPLGAHYYYIAS